MKPKPTVINRVITKYYFGLFLLSLLSAFIGQWLILNNHIYWGIAGYLLGVVIFLLVISQINLAPSFNKCSAKPKLEILILLAIILLTIFFRVYKINSLPYGVDEDESIWLSTTYHHFIKRDYQGEYEGWIKYIPVAFAQTGFFYKIFGANLIIGRLSLVFSSVLSIIFLYFLTKLITNNLVALVTVALYSTSWIDITTSRLAIFDNFVKPAVTGAYLFLALGLIKKRPWFFLLCGVCLALGLLTFINFHLTPFIALGYLIFYYIFIKRPYLKKALITFLLILMPILIVLPKVKTYFNMRFPEKSHKFKMCLSPQQTSDPNIFSYLKNNFLLISQGIFKQVSYDLQDFSYPNHQLTYESPFLIPLAMLGLIFSLYYLNRQFLGFPAVWFLFQLLPFPILLSYFGSRIILPAWPAFYILAGITIFLFGILTYKTFGRKIFKFILGFFVVLLIIITSFNFSYYLKSLTVFPFELWRDVRRDLYSVLPQKISQGQFVYLVHKEPPPGYVSLFAERNFLAFMASGAQDSLLTPKYQLISEVLLKDELRQKKCRSITLIYSKAEIPEFNQPLERGWVIENHPTLWIINIPKSNFCYP